MKKLKLVFFFAGGLFLFASCQPQVKPSETAATPSDALIRADMDFSRMIRERGVRNAFTHFMADDGVLLRPDAEPIIGADAIQYLMEINDTGYVISWHPVKAEISADGQLGYTCGIYKMVAKDTTIEGTYLNVWKNQNGQWKFVVNTGNQGLSSE